MDFSVGERVRIVRGPFEYFVGTIAAMNIEKRKLKVIVDLQGRETPVELDFLQVERL